MQEVLDIVPLSVTEWGIVIASALLPTLVAQARKVLRNGMVG